MTPKTGYNTCAPTAVGASCVVTCAEGYAGDSTQYKCELANGSPTFVSAGAENECAPTQYVQAHTCAREYRFSEM
jgi:hypothetical protein